MSELASLPAIIDRHFDAVDVSFAEMRQLVYEREEKLRTEMLAGFAGVDRRFDRVDARFDRLERKLDQFIDRSQIGNSGGA
jgi:hypothetical protein